MRSETAFDVFIPHFLISLFVSGNEDGNTEGKREREENCALAKEKLSLILQYLLFFQTSAVGKILPIDSL